jgi:redox-sensitive bicupin YhaK (pirin superfamily)
VSVIVRRADERYRSAQDGIVSRHCFSAGGFYEPDNTAFGPVVGCDEHRVEPGHGFARHAHRGVEIVSVVLAGVLRHEGADGTVLVHPGQVLWQATGGGIQHAETNGSAQPLLFVQTTWLSDRDDAAVALVEATEELAVAGGRFRLVAGPVATDDAAHIYVGSGPAECDGLPLFAGDSVRADEPVAVAGSGSLLVWTRDHERAAARLV